MRHGGTSVENRWVFLRIVRAGDRLSVSVSDKGHGFPQQVLDDLNDPDNKRLLRPVQCFQAAVSIYGPGSRLQVDSTPEGSTVSFSIPVFPPPRPERNEIS